MDNITYADVAGFYADKGDTCEIATGDYEKVASWVWEMEKNGVQQCIFLDHPKAKYEMSDNKAFALFVASRKGKKDGSEWQTISIYNKHKKDHDPLFHIWFTNQCKPNPNEKVYRPGQKWHLYEYILFQEIVTEYDIPSKATKLKTVDLKKDSFNYYKKNNSGYIELMVWMAENAGFKEKIEKALADANTKGKNLTCKDIRDCVSWEEIAEMINKWKANNPS